MLVSAFLDSKLTTSQETLDPPKCRVWVTKPILERLSGKNSTDAPEPLATNANFDVEILSSFPKTAIPW